jgi:hypothetical protein
MIDLKKPVRSLRCLFGRLNLPGDKTLKKQKTWMISWRLYAALMVFFILAQGILYPQLVSLYKRGSIKLANDRTFGAETDWESLFFDIYKDIAIGPDGSIFVSNDRQHTIFKFSSSGKLVKQFGRKGVGPGDLYSPGDLTILDGKYLVVGEFATSRRISLFDLNGNYVKILRTKHSCFSPLSLKDNRIAYLSFSYNEKDMEEVTVWIKHVDTGKEIPVTSSKLPDLSKIRAPNNYTMGFENQTGELIIARTDDGSLLVGVSNTQEINIYSPEGKRLRSFRLNIKPEPVTSRYINGIRQKYIDGVKEIKAARPYLDIIKKADFNKGFLDYLPYYRSIHVDSEGNILLFKWLDCVDNCPKEFQVYSSEGEFRFEVFLDEGEFEVDSGKKLLFTNKGIFAFVTLKNSDDISPRLIKVNVPVNN